MKMPNSHGLHYLRKNFDTAAIVSALSVVALSDDAAGLDDREHAILAALRRSTSLLEKASLPDIRSYLRGLDHDQVPGLVSNVKGILHEMQFVRAENEDGDNFYASFFEATNHPHTDIQLLDRSTGETWEAQLKATDDPAYVTEWIQKHPGGEILVTDELAKRMDVPTSGQSNNDLTTDVKDFVDRMISADDAADFWNYLPALSVASVALVVWDLWQRHKRSEIDRGAFKCLAARATGLKLAKIGAIGLLLSLPIVGQATGAVLVAQLLLSARATWYDSGMRVWPDPALQV